MSRIRCGYLCYPVMFYGSYKKKKHVNRVKAMLLIIHRKSYIGIMDNAKNRQKNKTRKPPTLKNGYHNRNNT